MNKDKLTFIFSLQSKLFSLVLVGFSLLIGIIAWSIGHEADTVANNSIDKALKRSSVIIQTKIHSRFSAIQETAKNLARDGRILPRVYEGDALTLQDLSLEFKKSLDFDMLFFTDAEGQILARSDRPEAIGSSVAGRSALFDSALDGMPAQGVLVSQGKLLQIVTVPIFDNVAKDVVRGTVALAYEISPSIADEIHTLTSSQIGLFIFTRNAQRQIDAVKSIYLTDAELQPSLYDYFSQQEQQWQSILDLDGGEKALNFHLNNEEFHGVAIPLAKNGGGNLGFILAMQSRTELLQPFVKIQQQVISVGILGLIIACFIAWFIAYRISRPIIKLVAITRDIARGDYPQSTTIETRRDEVGLLFNAVLKMGKSLKEKSDLENYLAQLSEDLGEEIDLFDNDIENSLESHLEKSSATDKAETVMATIETGSATVIDTHVSEKVLTGNRQHSATKDPQSILPEGKMINNRYRIIKLLGVGAAGQVYLALDNDLNEKIALKMLDPNTFDQAESEQFKQEIRLARRITHRNIIRTFDLGRCNGSHYISMEYVHGYDLNALIKMKGALDIAIGVLMAKQICSAVAAAHEQGIIHRDLKPSNMMVNRQGIIKIMDFGLAMQIKASDVNQQQANDQPLAAKVSGTPNFMAPEQFLGQPLDQRSDIYAIGVILYIIFSGKPPFKADNFAAYAQCHLMEKPPSLSAEINLSTPALQEIIHKCMQKEMDARYASIKELMEDLQKI
ncbi:MAG: protein kinase [Pseudomonadales bacterium]|nr:protein kinase [Pseudomonadales bacterium]